ncbi:hypothetical protein H9X57_02480 [Flavobacterium piscinae]|uniref:hypothetical protein n=1 Tax=Flavobacterium piscinae TaxID=2506424 RepID=UPI001995DFB4|nr:hypothetical protein [Flavobacterium piscinae]MBC8882669.1 hypothetical protein [Flavobacterium piscinae]
MILYDKHKGNHFESKEIIAELKSKFGKMLIFLLVLFFLGITAGLILMGLVVALMFVLVGFLLLIILGPALLAFVQLSFYEYLNAEIGIFEAMGKGFEKLKQNFWPIIGSTIVMYFIVQIVISIFRWFLI